MRIVPQEENKMGNGELEAAVEETAQAYPKPSLSEFSFEELQNISDSQRKTPVIVPKQGCSRLKKAVIDTFLVAALAVSSMYLGAKYSSEINYIQEKVASYFQLISSHKNTNYEPKQYGGN